MKLKISPELMAMGDQAHRRVANQYMKYVMKITVQNTDNEMMGVFRKKRIKDFREWLSTRK